MSTTLNPLLMPGSVVQVIRTQTTAVITSTGTYSSIDAPTPSGGTLLMFASITPKLSTSILLVNALAMFGHNENSMMSIILFRDAGSSAVAAMALNPNPGNTFNTVMPQALSYSAISGSPSATTFTLRGGSSDGSIWSMNGAASGVVFYTGGIVSASLTITEIAA